MNPDLTDIAFVLDRSGSMSSVAEAAIAGFNDFLREQQAAPGHARLTVVLFDDEYLLHVDALPVSEVVPLDHTTFVPRNTTALLDAIGRTIDTLGQRLAQTPEPQRPGKVIVAILTDGLENSSTQYTWRALSQTIRHQREKYGWEFLFLGANQDAIATAAQLHIQPGNAATFSADHLGTSSGAAAVSRRTSSIRRASAGRASMQDEADLAASMSELLRQEEQKKKQP